MACTVRDSVAFPSASRRCAASGVLLRCASPVMGVGHSARSASIAAISARFGARLRPANSGLRTLLFAIGVPHIVSLARKDHGSTPGCTCLDRLVEGFFVASVSSGVRHKPHALPAVGRADIVSTHHERPAGVACRFQVAHDLVGGAGAYPWDVLADDPARLEFSDDPRELGPEVAVVGLGTPLSRDAEGLAGEASDDGVRSNNASCSEGIRTHLPHIVENRHAWKLPAQHGTARLVHLHERDRAEPAGLLEAVGERAHAAEQIEGGVAAHQRLRAWRAASQAANSRSSAASAARSFTLSIWSSAAVTATVHSSVGTSIRFRAPGFRRNRLIV